MCPTFYLDRNEKTADKKHRRTTNFQNYFKNSLLVCRVMRWYKNAVSFLVKLVRESFYLIVVISLLSRERFTRKPIAKIKALKSK